MRSTALATLIVAGLLPLMAPIPPVFAADGAAAVTQPDALTWGPAAGLPPGAQVAVLYGDPSKTGPFALRFKFPAGYVIASHSHPTDEFITVISGKGRMAFGADASEASAQPLMPGTFTSLPAGSLHRLWIDADTVVELHSTGPFGTEMH